MSGRGFIAVEPERECELCHKWAECRPYGPHDEQICHECGERDPATTERKMRAYVFGEETQ